MEPELTPISKSKKAQARFANTLFDLCAPAFAMAAATFIPYLQTVAAPAIASARLSLPVFELPVPPQPCAQACIPLVQTPLAHPSHPTSITGALPHSITHPPSAPCKRKRKQKFMPPPDLTYAQRDYDDLDARLYPKRIKVQPSTPFTCDKTTRTRLERVLDLLSIYTYPDASIRTTWINASLRVAKEKRKSPATAERLRLWAWQWITDRQVPANLYGLWRLSMLDDGDFSQKIHEHLQRVGEYRKAEDCLCFRQRSFAHEASRYGSLGS
jgi:hypothetical protein